GVPDRVLDELQLTTVRHRDGRVGEASDLQDADGLAVAESALAARSPPAVAESRRGHDPAHELAVTLEREQRRPDRHAAEEVPRAVDRVDDPANRARVLALLLAEDALAGPGLGDPLAQRPLDGPVGVGHRRQVGLRLDPQVECAEARQAERVRNVGELQGEVEVGRHPPSLKREGGLAGRPRRPESKTGQLECVAVPSIVCFSGEPPRPIWILRGLTSSGFATRTSRTPFSYDAEMSPSLTPWGRPSVRWKLPKRRS